MHNRRWAQDITGPLTVPTLVQFLHVWSLVDSVNLSNVADRFVWRWVNQGHYFSNLAYQAMLLGSVSFEGASLVWKSWATYKVKFFAWLALHSQLWTVVRRHRHGLQPDESCTHCSQLLETTYHMFLHCPLGREVWWRILGIQAPTATVSLIVWWLDLRRCVTSDFRKGVDSLILLTWWRLWLARNDIIFNNHCISSDS